MKTVKLFIIFLLFSLHAGATGYSHNMFVAHKKLQGVYAPAEKPAVKKARTWKVKPQNQVSAGQNKVISKATTLNERVLEEGPESFFNKEAAAETDKTIVTKLVEMVKCVVYAFVGYPALS
ncbi:hypothetical protein [Dyadobacter sandarakinus]|uniref:Uncharacterized protein n=1 Tax=Dyadobacter sandarakinus TaxID=2747268 RepID=A0ABX7I9N2_9BACT|nr:hypothetical protein [Dyadobacter sandarakinus]QRR02814.1 hypothetical protein HWI92_18790 [Dyadobacter sandarakinus]